MGNLWSALSSLFIYLQVLSLCREKGGQPQGSRLSFFGVAQHMSNITCMGSYIQSLRFSHMMTRQGTLTRGRWGEACSDNLQPSFLFLFQGMLCCSSCPLYIFRFSHTMTRHGDDRGGWPEQWAAVFCVYTIHTALYIHTGSHRGGSPGAVGVSHVVTGRYTLYTYIGAVYTCVYMHVYMSEVSE